ncbi:MAG: hypothetical protein STHCBS139747_002860 [Sporothrix thermara]
MAPELALDADFVQSTEARQRLHEMAQDVRVRELLRQADPLIQQQYLDQQRQLHATTPSVPRDPTYLVDFIDYSQPAAAQAEAEQLAFQQLQQIHFMQRQTQAAQPQPERRELAELDRQHLLSIQRLEEDQLRGIVEQRRQERLRQQVQRQAQRPVLPHVRVTVTQGAGPTASSTQVFPLLQQRHVSVMHHGAASRQPQQPQASATTSGASVGPQQAAGRPNVYLLESPSGPRAVLINRNVGMQATPATQAAPAVRAVPVPVPQAAPAHIQNEQWYVNLIQQHNLQIQQQQQHYQFIIQQNMRHVEMLHRLQRQQIRQNQLQHQAAMQQAVPYAQDPHQLAGAARPGPVQVPNLHRAGLNNPGVGALAAMWPHIWLLARLILFVWWFTSPSASWTRWATVIMMAIAVFVFNTGILDEVANQAWAPVRAHLDGFVPMPNANADAVQQVVGQNARNGQNGQNATAPEGDVARDTAATMGVAGPAGGAEPDPHATAARLVAERRRNNGRRLRDFAQRLERLGIMFLASLAPGIAERHVALAEEREREEQRRLQEAAEAAVAAAAEAQAQAEAAAAAAAAAALEASKTSEASEALEESTGAALQATVEDDDSAEVDAQWRNEEQIQDERAAAQ